MLRSREARSALKRIPRVAKIQTAKNAMVVPGQKKTTQCDASVNARRVSRSAYFGRPVWVVLLQTQMAGTLSPKMKRSAGKKRGRLRAFAFRTSTPRAQRGFIRREGFQYLERRNPTLSREGSILSGEGLSTEE